MSDLWSDYVRRLEKLTEGNTSTQDLSYGVNVSLKHKYIFVETAKVACSTIKLTLQRLELEDPNFERKDFEDLHIREYSPLIKLQQLANFESYFKRDDFYIFCFVRNPYTRLLSCYLDKIYKPTHFKKAVLKGMGLDENDINHPVSFEEFIEVIEQQTPIEMNNHWRPQAHLICLNTIEYNKIGRLENFSDDFSLIGKQLSPDFSKFYAPEVRHQTDANSLLKKYYNDDLYARVYEIYKVDFLSFSYDRDYNLSSLKLKRN